MKKNKTILGRLKTIGCRLDAIIESCEGEVVESDLTSFQGSSMKANPCSVNDIEVPIDTTYYHDGEGAYPDVGDTVYTDAAGTMVLDTSTLPDFPTSPAFQGNAIHTDAPSGVPTDENGVVQVFTCR